MPCPTPCWARVQGEYFTIDISLSIAHWHAGNRQWKSRADSSFVMAAEPRSSSAAAATGASSIVPEAAPKPHAALRSRKPATATRRAEEAASSMPKEAAVTGCAGRM